MLLRESLDDVALLLGAGTGCAADAGLVVVVREPGTDWSAAVAPGSALIAPGKTLAARGAMAGAQRSGIWLNQTKRAKGTRQFAHGGGKGRFRRRALRLLHRERLKPGLVDRGTLTLGLDHAW